MMVVEGREASRSEKAPNRPLWRSVEKWDGCNIRLLERRSFFISLYSDLTGQKKKMCPTENKIWIPWERRKQT